MIEPFKPCAIYNRDGDMIDVLFKNVPYYARWINDQVTELRAVEGDKIIGVQIVGIKKILKEGSE